MPEPGGYLTAVGWVEVTAGLLLAFGPQLLQEISNFILSVVMIGESWRAPTALCGVLGHPQPETPIPTLCSLPRCYLHAAGVAGATGHVCPGHPLPRPPPAAQHPRVPGHPSAQVRVTRGGKDRWLGRWEAMPLWHFQGRHRILQGNLLLRHSVSSTASASDSGAGSPHTAGPGPVLWDGGHGTTVTLLWCCSGSSIAKLAEGVQLFPVFGHTEQGLALLSRGLSNFGIKPLVFHVSSPCLFLPPPMLSLRGEGDVLGLEDPVLGDSAWRQGLGTCGSWHGSWHRGRWTAGRAHLGWDPSATRSHPVMCQAACCTSRE